MPTYTLKPIPADCVDGRTGQEILAAAEVVHWPDVLIQPEQRIVSPWDARTVRVAGRDGWAVFVQLMDLPQLLAARRLLLRLATHQGADEADG